MASQQSVVDLTEYSGVLRRRWPLLLGAIIAGAVLGLLALQLQTAEYVATSQVEVRAVRSADASNVDVDRQINTSTERAIAASQRVTERALKLLAASDGNLDRLDDPEVEAAADTGVADPDAVKLAEEQVEVSFLPDTQVLEFTASTGRPERARDLAQSMAHAYLDFRGAEARGGAERAREMLVERQAALEEELRGMAQEIANARNAEDEGTAAALEFATVAKREELAGIGSTLAGLGALTIDPGVVLDDADLPEEPTGLPSILGLVSGAVLGLGVGLLLSFLLDKRDDRIRSGSAEVGELGLDVLGSVPVGRGRYSPSQGPAIADLTSPVGEAYRRLQGSLLFALDRSDRSVVLVAGTNNPHSSTTVAANLAVAAARSGRRTLIIGADLRRPSLHDRFNLQNGVGLSDVLLGDNRLVDALRPVPSVKNLTILTAGTIVTQPAVLLQGEGLGRLMSSVSQEFDLVVVEAPPVLQVADAVDLARLAEGSVLVVEPERATRAGVASAVDQLQRVGSEVVGAIVAETSRDS